jgi:hypothetical protein
LHANTETASSERLNSRAAGKARARKPTRYPRFAEVFLRKANDFKGV